MKIIDLPNGDVKREYFLRHFNESVRQHWQTAGGRLCRAPQLLVTWVQQLFNPLGQQAYCAELKDHADLCGHRVNQLSTFADNFQRLFQHGLDPQYADSNARGMYGLGIYLSVGGRRRGSGGGERAGEGGGGGGSQGSFECLKWTRCLLILYV